MPPPPFMFDVSLEYRIGMNKKISFSCENKNILVASYFFSLYNVPVTIIFHDN